MLDDKEAIPLPLGSEPGSRTLAIATIARVRVPRRRGSSRPSSRSPAHHCSLWHAALQPGTMAPVSAIGMPIYLDDQHLDSLFIVGDPDDLSCPRLRERRLLIGAVAQRHMVGDDLGMQGWKRASKSCRSLAASFKPVIMLLMLLMMRLSACALRLIALSRPAHDRWSFPSPAAQYRPRPRAAWLWLHH